MKRLLAFKTFFLGIVLASASAGDVFAAKGKILFLHNTAAQFTTLVDSMKKELGAGYEYSQLAIITNDQFSDFTKKVEEEKPNLLVLLDNPAVNLAIQYNEQKTAPAKKVPAVALMSLNLKSILRDNKEIAGIAFESPAYTLVTSFRSITKQPIKKVFVFYRKSVFEKEIKDTAVHLAGEKIEFSPIDVEQNGKNVEAMKATLDREYKKIPPAPGTVLWVMLDSGILTTSLFREFWLPAAKKNLIPFLSGMAEFINPNLDFVVFGVTPDLDDLSTQATQMVESIMRDGTKPSIIGVENLISVHKIINKKKASALNLPISEENLSDVRILE